ncbi:aspartic peptidase domain-containing protein [Aspergillus bertholletiae]|uniref:Aspartic peptidase domain-containing protein n=1 Tax=Aspergillus bertholletiae TaxID=1226010 RepID=A0A5N7BFZ8_9EURO|nr:aspartic peptidase domain-containing protein [Aspergillus bertholletiae]
MGTTSAEWPQSTLPKTIKLWCLALGATYYANALTLEKKDTPSVLAVPFEAGRFADVRHHRCEKRDHTVSLGFYGNDFFYTTISVGNQPQNLKAQFSTLDDSSWVVASDNDELADFIKHGDFDGYNANASTSSRSVKRSVTIDGFDRDNVGNVDIMSDTMVVGDVKLEAMKFASLREKAAIGDTLGLGYSHGHSEFISVTQALVDAKAIQSPAFSMWKEEQSQNHTNGPGTILFGGVNKARYVDELHTLPVVSPAGLSKLFRVNLTGLSVGGPGPAAKSISPDAFSTGAVFSSATDFIGFPETIAKDLFAQLGMLTFHFGDVAFNFSLNPFIALAPSATDPKRKELDGAIIGANFLKLVYIVFDMENDEIPEIKSGKGSVPDRTTTHEETTGKTDTTADMPEKTTESAGSNLESNNGLKAALAAGAVFFVAVMWG